MRMLIGLLFCLPLLAQDVEGEKEKAEDRVLEVKVARDGVARGRVVELAKALAEEKDDARRKEMIRELVEVLTKQAASDTLVSVNDMPLRLRAATNPFEAMNGSWEEDGQKGTYTMKSLGGGRYRLKARREGKEGTFEEIERDGSLADLRREYPWLKAGNMVFVFGDKREVSAANWGPGEGASLRSDNGFVPDATVGIMVESVPEELAHHLVLVSGEGLMVKHVMPGSRAEKLGLRRFDVLMRIGGERIESPAQLKRLNEEKGTLEIIRRGERRTIELK